MNDLSNLQPKHEFFIGIDSDGCAFPSMELKHKECFIPEIIRHFGLQSISKYTRESAEFVNLYSSWRGANRFLALLKVMELLETRSEVRDSLVKIPNFNKLKIWCKEESNLGNPTLIEKIKKTKDSELQKILEWSTAVNAAVEKMVFNLPPFSQVTKVLEMVKPKADIAVVSATPTDVLEREWKEHKIDHYVQVIAGQEMGNKKEHLIALTQNKYPSEKILMIGDALGDLRAVKSVGGLFFPIKPGQEEKSWKLFLEEGLNQFFDGSYLGTNEANNIKEFNDLLPDEPDWIT